MLLGPEGELLDDRIVAPRIEETKVIVRPMGSEDPPESTADDRTPLPEERDAAIRATIQVEAEARRAAAHRRISTAGELEEYLRWRFSCRAGELLLLDPGLFSQDREEDVVRFLAGFNRPIRVLVRGVHQKARDALSAAGDITVKALPGGGKTLSRPDMDRW